MNSAVRVFHPVSVAVGAPTSGCRMPARSFPTASTLGTSGRCVLRTTGMRLSMTPELPTTRGPKSRSPEPL